VLVIYPWLTIFEMLDVSMFIHHSIILQFLNDIKNQMLTIVLFSFPAAV